MVQVSFNKLYLPHFETSGGLNTELKGCTRKVRANYKPICMRQIQAHLAGPASDLHYARVTGNRSINQARKLAPFGACSQPTQARPWRIVGERRLLVKTTYTFSSRVARQSQVWNAIGRFVARAADTASPIGRERARTRRAS